MLGHTDVHARTYNDWDSGEFNFYIDYFNNEVELTSHEFQLLGGNDRISWVGGAYLWDQEGRNRIRDRGSAARGGLADARVLRLT